MLSHAIIVNDNFIVSQKIEHIYDGDITVDCNAIMKAFMESRTSEITGGTLFATGCPGLNEASMIIAAMLNKVVFTREPANSDEMCALELLKERNIEIVLNPNIIL